MSAIPKKKLCWNCDGNVSKEVDNCPYCGVYLHASEIEEENSLWNYSSPSTKAWEPEEETSEVAEEESEEQVITSSAIPFFQHSPAISQEIKRDVLSVLFLMTGSIFFLFGTILFLFADEQGNFTLQWKASYWIYFFSAAVPLLYMGWRFLNQLDDPESK